MKKLLTLCLTVLLIAVCTTAFAERKKFDRFSVEVPNGWVAQQVDANTAAIAHSSGACAITVSYGPKSGQPLGTLAELFSKGMNGTAPVKDADGDYTFEFKAADKDSYALVSEDGNDFVMITVIGAHADAEAILNSME